MECYIVVFLLVNESQNALHVSSKEKLLDGATPFAQKFELLSSPSALLGLEFFWNLLFPAQFRTHQAALASLLVYLYLNCRQSKSDFIDKCLQYLQLEQHFQTATQLLTDFLNESETRGVGQCCSHRQMIERRSGVISTEKGEL